MKSFDRMKESKHDGNYQKNFAFIESNTDADVDVEEDEELASVTAQTPMGQRGARGTQDRMQRPAVQKTDTTIALMRRTPGANVRQLSAYPRGTSVTSCATKDTAVVVPSHVQSSSLEGHDHDEEDTCVGTGPLGYGFHLPSHMSEQSQASTEIHSQSNGPISSALHKKKAMSLESLLDLNHRPALHSISTTSLSTSTAPLPATATVGSLSAADASANPLISPKLARPTHLILNTSLQHPEEYRGRNSLYTPASISLAKNQELNLQALSGTFSPHTVRLTEALDHLLQEDDEEEVDTVVHMSTQSDTHGASEQENTIHDLYSLDSFAESLTGMDRVITHDDYYWDNDASKIFDVGGDGHFYGAVTDEGDEEYEDDYASSAGSFFFDPSYEQRQQSTATQTLYHAYNVSQEQHQYINPILNMSCRPGNHVSVSSGEFIPSRRHHSQPFHKRTSSGGSSSNGSGPHCLIFTDGVQNQNFNTASAPFHRHTHSGGSSSLGSVQGASISSINSKSPARRVDPGHGNALKPPAMLSSSFQRFTRSSSGSTLGSVGASSIGIDVTQGGLNLLSEDGSTARAMRSSEGGAFVPATKALIGVPGVSSSSSWKPPVPERSYQVSSYGQPVPQVTNASLLMQQTTKRKSGRESSSHSRREETGRPKMSVYKTDVHRMAQSHIQQAPVIIHHHHHHYNKDVPFYTHYNSTLPMPTVDEQYYYPTHSMRGSQSPPPFIPSNYLFNHDIASNQVATLHPMQYSPETIPQTNLSPLTIPSIYPAPNMSEFYHSRISPIPFTTIPTMEAQVSTTMPWSSEITPSPIPWHPAMNRDSSHSPYFSYNNYHLSSSSSGVVSPTPMGSTWMIPLATYSDITPMYPPSNPYSHSYSAQDNYPQTNTYRDLKKVVNNFNQVAPVSDASSTSQDYQRNSSHGLRKESLASFPWEQGNYKSVSNKEKAGKRIEQTPTDHSRSMQSSTTQKKNEPKGTPTDWSDSVIENTFARIKPSGPDSLSETQELEYGESATNRAALKSFYYIFRLKEKESLETALIFADQSLETKSVPEALFWRVYLELADLNKRKGNVKEARSYFNKACSSSPQSPEVWMEYTKFEEERGHIKKCSQLLYKGLAACDFNEALLIRAVKFEEKLSIDNSSRDLSRARALLCRLKNVNLDKSWRALLEGAMLESRAGNVETARRVFSFLVHHIPWYGPLYIEFHVLERDLGRLHDSLMVVEKGLKENSRYGPLWFQSFEICEILDLQEKNFSLPRLSAMTERALQSISKELIWKVYLEAALAQERAATISDEPLKELMVSSRKAFIKAVLASPDNMRWKCWLAAARAEVSFGDVDKARRICLMSYNIVPSKGRATVIIELARLEDFAGNLDLARALLCKAREEYSSEWKVWLETVNLEARNGKRLRAVKFCIESLKMHSGTGRLWSALAQLLQPDGERVYLSVLETAVTAVPKSGEVWCEVARMFLNPLCPTFHPASARKYLNYGIKFTPQYGDSFLETLRLDLLEHYVEPIAIYFGQLMENQLKNVARDDVALFFDSAVNSIQDACNSVTGCDTLEVHPNFPLALISLKNFKGSIGVKSDIELRCRNADPNYGLMWFYCRHSPIDSAHVILQRTKYLIREELAKYSFVYLAAWLRRRAVEIFNGARDSMDANLSRSFTSRLRQTVTVDDILKQGLSSDGIDTKFSANDFSTGLVQLQRLSITNRKKCLFGVDSLLAQ